MVGFGDNAVVLEFARLGDRLGLFDFDPGQRCGLYAIVLVVINGISLVFDLYDSYRWLRGECGIARAPG